VTGGGSWALCVGFFEPASCGVPVCLPMVMAPTAPPLHLHVPMYNRVLALRCVVVQPVTLCARAPLGIDRAPAALYYHYVRTLMLMWHMRV
jgi:hypothetical protein